MTTAAELPEKVKKFILEKIDSYGQLQILLLLARDSVKFWTKSEIAREFRANENSVEKNLKDLMNLGLVQKSDSPPFQYSIQSRDPGLTRIIQDVLEAHLVFSTRIISLIYDKPVERIRGLAEAFKIRRNDDNG